MTTPIPVVDLSSDGAAAAVSTAYGEVGFAYLVGHDIPRDLIDRVFAASRAFHDLPIERKMSIELDHHHRGYIPIDSSTDRTSTLAVVTKPNQSASFMMMRDDPDGSPDAVAGTYLAGSNQWPDLPGFRRPVEAYHAAMCELGRRVIDVVSVVLDDRGGVLARAFDTPTSWLRLLHYPPVPSTEALDLYGSAPHRDFGCITILAQDDVGGLQVGDGEGAWIDVPPRPDAFVMNVGDMLHRWSNGRLLSTPHRVINRSGRQRYSVPFFFDPHMSTTVEPLPSCVDDGHPPRFAPIQFATFVRAELTAAYDHHRHQ